ncbi:hypothetical protein CANCADRAFT_13950, partial [Tortispora caseinolytica NRRL Y-17796]
SGKSSVKKRPVRHLEIGKTRPNVPYRFDCRVELSDGSTYVRKSVFPRAEWRYIKDIRNQAQWNPSIAAELAAQMEAGGRMARFQRRF